MAAASSRRPLEEKTGSVISPRVASSGLPCFALFPATGEVTPPPKKYCMTETMARPGGASHDAVEPGAPAMSQSLAQNVTKNHADAKAAYHPSRPRAPWRFALNGVRASRLSRRPLSPVRIRSVCANTALAARSSVRQCARAERGSVPR